MNSIPVKSVQISPERQRKVFNPEAIGKLAESIVSKGLMHPIILRDREDVLVSGERRIRAIELIYTMRQTFSHNGEAVPVGHVPFTRLHDLSPELVYEAELEENIRRENLTPQEELQAIARLHKFRLSQNPAHTLQDTAIELGAPAGVKTGAYSTEVRDALLVDEHLSDPAVAKAKSKSEAIKAVHKKIQREHALNLAGQFTKLSELDSPHVAVQGEAIEILKKMPSGIVDVICTDPPYGIDAQDFGNMAANEHHYDDSYETWKKFMPEILQQMYRVTKTHAHMYMFCAFERMDELAEMMWKSGWTVWPKPLIWYKRNGMLPKPKLGPRYTYETILFATKGAKEIQIAGAHDVIDISLAQDIVHAAQKPVALYENLLSRSTLPGDHVLDPFMGSGTIFPAANRLKLRATGIEQNEIAFGFAIQRLEEKE